MIDWAFLYMLGALEGTALRQASLVYIASGRLSYQSRRKEASIVREHVLRLERVI